MAVTLANAQSQSQRIMVIFRSMIGLSLLLILAVEIHEQVQADIATPFYVCAVIAF